MKRRAGGVQRLERRRGSERRMARMLGNKLQVIRDTKIEGQGGSKFSREGEIIGQSDHFF